MDININFSYGEESVHNLAFINALFIKFNIEKLNISYRRLTIKSQAFFEKNI